MDGTLGERLKAAREKIRPKLSQDELAKRIGVKGGRRTVIRWESDENVPQTEYRSRLVQELSLPGDFFSDAERPGEARLSRRVASLEQAVARIERQLFGAGAAQDR